MYRGSSIYSPPEGILSKKSDVWQLGVVWYMLIAGYPPFVGCNRYETLSLINDMELGVSFQGVAVSKETQELIELTLKKDAAKRIRINKLWN